MSIALAAWTDIKKYASVLTPPIVRERLGWFVAYLAALLAPLDSYMTAEWPALYQLVQDQKGKNAGRLYIQYALNRAFNTTGFQVEFGETYIPRKYIRFNSEGFIGYDRFNSEGAPPIYDRFHSEFVPTPQGMIIAPAGFTYTSDPFNAIAAVVDAIRIPCQLYTITIDGTTQTRPN